MKTQPDKWEATEDGKTVHVKRHWDAQPYLDRVKMAQEVKPISPEMVHAGSIPMFLVEQWMREEGIDWTDTEGRVAMLKRKLQDGSYALLRGDERLYRNRK